MAYRIKRRESLRAGVKRIVSRELDRAAKQARDQRLGLDVRVHQLRSSLKRASAALRLVHGGGGKRARRCERRLREVRRDLAHAREIAVERDTLRRLRHALQGLGSAPLLAAMAHAEERAARRAESRSVSAPLETAVRALGGRRRRARGLGSLHPLRRSRRPARRGLEDAYARARRAFLDLGGDDHDAESFHAWRKAVKRLAHQTRLLRGAAPDLWEGLGQPLDALGDVLGEAHDLAMLRARVASRHKDDRALAEAFADETTRALLFERIDAEIAARHQGARLRGAALLVASPREIAERLDDGWRAWRRKHGRARASGQRHAALASLAGDGEAAAAVAAA